MRFLIRFAMNLGLVLLGVAVLALALTVLGSLFGLVSGITGMLAWIAGVAISASLVLLILAWCARAALAE